jgi:L-lactate dehydrogenase complex protein LldF
MSRNTASDYNREAAKALASPPLQASLQSLQQRLGQGAMAIWAGLADPEKRKRVKASRMRTLAHLDIILTVLADKVRERGGLVYFAETAQDAVDYTLAVAKKNAVKRVVKGKSMTSIEINVDPALAEAGIEVVETDLGEYIVQLAGEPPSHIIAPCIHKDRKQIGTLFAEKLGIEFSEDPPTLTRAARRALREKMLNAEMGLTGCNLACAETGQISLVSNEGNIRMTTTMPQIHVAIMGMERVVATMDEHRETLELLTRGAALQNISTYVSFLGGPDQDGGRVREFHLVIVDNGRSKILADPEFREVLACIRCGACLNICPVYGKIGGHAYGAAYCGPIGAVVSPLLDGINKHADLCKGETLCGACRDICPVENDLPRMLAALRHKLAYGSDQWQTRQHDPAEAYAFHLWRQLVTRPALYRTGLRLGRLLQWPFSRKGKLIARMLGIASGWTTSRDLPPLARRSFTEIWREKHPETKGAAEEAKTSQVNGTEKESRP